MLLLNLANNRKNHATNVIFNQKYGNCGRYKIFFSFAAAATAAVALTIASFPYRQSELHANRSRDGIWIIIEKCDYETAEMAHLKQK